MPTNLFDLAGASLDLVEMHLVVIIFMVGFRDRDNGEGGGVRKW